MAQDMNMVALVGRLTRDPEIKYTSAGAAVLNMSLAVNRRKKSGDSWTDEVSYFDVQLWGKLAESLVNYLTKGKQVAIQGELRQSRWEQDGQKRSKVSIIAQTLQMLADPQGNNAQQYHAGGQQNRNQNPPRSGNSQQTNRPRTHAEFAGDYSNQQQPDTPEYGGPEFFADDIPF